MIESGRKPKKIQVKKTVNSAIDQQNNGCRTMMEKCIQYLMKENPLLLKDLLET